MNPEEEFEQITSQLSDPAIFSKPEEYQKLSRRYIELQKQLKKSIGNQSENTQQEKGRSALVEIRAGVGGDEAALFVGILYKMYSGFAAKKGWKTFIIDSNETDIGGLKEVTFKVAGADAFKILQLESGVHRVQRIPETEKNGRIHTSTATVAVLPEATEVDVKINPEDLKIDIYRAGGPGGQNVNKVETAVRITHLPTNIVVACQKERFQQRNREEAMKLLLAKLYDLEIQRQQDSISSQRKQQIGSADRSEKIRTYNFPQDRLTDHRINKSWHNLEKIIAGNLEPIVEEMAKLND